MLVYFLLGLVVGVFLGSFAGLLGAGLCYASRLAQEERE